MQLQNLERPGPRLKTKDLHALKETLKRTVKLDMDCIVRE